MPWPHCHGISHTIDAIKKNYPVSIARQIRHLSNDTGVIKGVEKYLKDKKKALAPEKKARLISLLYGHFAKTGEDVDQGTVVSYLRLVA